MFLTFQIQHSICRYVYTEILYINTCLLYNIYIWCIHVYIYYIYTLYTCEIPISILMVSRFENFSSRSNGTPRKFHGNGIGWIRQYLKKTWRKLRHWALQGYFWGWFSLTYSKPYILLLVGEYLHFRYLECLVIRDVSFWVYLVGSLNTSW